MACKEKRFLKNCYDGKVTAEMLTREFGLQS